MYVIFGLGMQGEAILHYLLEATSEKIVGIDISQDRLVQIMPHTLEYGDRVCLKYPYSVDDFSKGSVIISCLPPDENELLTVQCVTNRCHMVDLGGSTAVVRRQLQHDRQAADMGSAIVPDCGLAPGIVSSFAEHYRKSGWTSVEAFCGGIPKFPKPPLSYAKVFSTDGVIREYTGVAQEIRDWRVVNVPALSGREFLFVPALGVLEAAVTTGGVSFSPDHFARNSLERFSYKTLRYPGHWDYVERHILSQPDPVRTLDALIDSAGPDNPDVIVLAFRMKDNKHVVGSFTTKFYFWEYDSKLGFGGLSAMAQSTGFVAGAVATILHDGKAPRSGVLGMHEISPRDITRRITDIFPDQFCEFPLDFGENGEEEEDE